MKVGKLNWDDLKNIINNNRGAIREDVKVRSSIGEDCSVIDFGKYDCVISTDPITGAGKNSGRLAVNINCNDIASSGIEPIGIMVTILAPENTSIEEIKSLMKEIHDESKKLNVEILGGHTEVTRAVNKIVISCTVIGKGASNSSIATSGAIEGDDILVTKLLCLEGTSIIVNDYKDKIKEILNELEIEEASSYIDYISVVEEGVIAGKFGVNSMHDITEGGVLGALWEVAKASDLGFEVYENKMPISNITKKICSEYNVDPLKLISSGSMLITCKNGKNLVNTLGNKGIKATIIGKITKGEGILVKEGEKLQVPPPERDELFKLEEKLVLDIKK